MNFKHKKTRTSSLLFETAGVTLAIILIVWLHGLLPG